MGKKVLSFSFKFIDRKKIFNELQKLKHKKACKRFPSLFIAHFQSNLKNAPITPVFFKNMDRETVENYRPVNILQVLPKVYERYVYHQMYAYLNKILSKWQCGFR